ncbi:MAG: hypothetical protein ACR2NN_04760 [Bryobacteraceae bacterium]
MLPNSLLSETIAQADGIGPVADVSEEAGRLLVLTLGITRIIEQESLEVSIWGSTDKTNWGAAPLVSFPQKFYCGMYSILLNLSSRPGIKYLQAQWKMSRWARGYPTPLFEFYVDAEPSGARMPNASAATAGTDSTHALAS